MADFTKNHPVATTVVLVIGTVVSCYVQGALVGKYCCGLLGLGD